MRARISILTLTWMPGDQEMLPLYTFLQVHMQKAESEVEARFDSMHSEWRERCPSHGLEVLCHNARTWLLPS